MGAKLNTQDEKMLVDVTTHLLHGLKSELRPSPIHGIGTFAIRDIKKGEKMFPRWGGMTRVYLMKPKEFEKFPNHVKKLICKSYVNKPEEQEGFYWFRLYKGAYFNLANPWTYVNTGEEDGNICSEKRVALRDIKKDEEILSNYKLKDTLQYSYE